MAESWSDREVDLVVDYYFRMLTLELSGERYSKTEHRRELASRVARSDGSLEFKFQNISAVLDELGARWINGYKPRRNVQNSLRMRVTNRFEQSADLRHDMMRAVEAPAVDVDPTLGPIEAPPRIDRPTSRRPRSPRRVDYAAVEAGNRSLGLAGERAVVDFERAVLERAGRSDLAAEVVHTSVEVGDGLGYDVRSFDPGTETERFIEVKTTRGAGEVPFYLTKNEIDFSEEAGVAFELRRLFDFGARTRQYRLAGPLSENVWLEPQSFLAGPA
ncbi:DUF3883 domain-containing protein [Nocardioides sp. Kera G14]|uniref:DUF3883 domain-containing protein n=1 Tax=Nocardioides sp. Kera G14 TaxID=2884264 RepID=UPI001D0F9246|nr:DUF3883 domain-containing protein [Nocardioides sp. Kera G14]UDY24159.1 DUF3883 domain-containing protein [Nocardioides sp. Kera G14]